MSNEMSIRVEGQELVLERVFGAPRQLVFKAFTESDHLKHWWGPQGWTMPVCKVDLRPGGVWHYCMKCEDRSQGDFYGMESWGKGVYQEIEAPEKLVYTDYFSDAEGNIAPDMPPSDVSLIFTEEEGQTKVVSRSRFHSEKELQAVMEMGMEQGIRETWDRLAGYLPTVL